MRDQGSKLSALRQLSERFFLMADVGGILGAMMCEAAGFAAVTTSSVGLGLELGCPGSEAVPKDMLMQATRDLCRAVQIPVCIDLESGYAETPDGVETVAAEVIAAGAVGFNLEDSDGIPGAGLRPAEEHAKRIQAARRAAESSGLPIHIVGRTDPFWLRADVSDADRTADAIRRANIYLESGADAIFISGRNGLSIESLTRLVAGVNGPLNTLIDASGPSLEEYRQIGVRRLQTGSLLTRAQAGYVREAMRVLLETGDVSALRRYAASTKELNEIVAPFWASRNIPPS